MTMPALIWGSKQSLAIALGLMGTAAITLAWSYGRARTSRSVKVGCAVLKALGFAALALVLLEPLLTGSRPRRGANAFVILADNSQSLQIRDEKTEPTRGEWLRARIGGDSPWKTRLGQDYDVRSYVFDSHLRAVEGFGGLAFDGTGSTLATSLAALSRRFHGLPLAGILLFSDGNRTDTGDVDWSQLPPVYPVVPPSRGGARDVGVNQVSISQTNFESAPIVIRADVAAVGFPGETIVATVTDLEGKEVERQETEATGEDRPLGFRFQFRPEHRGVNFYRVAAFPASEESKDKRAVATETTDPATSEQTLANNSRLVVVDQGTGPYRVLYVSGRPNWEFKFLRRAIAEDEQVQLVGLVRIARRQPKFDFRDARTQANSRLFQGFEHPDPDTAERADQPVLVRLGTLDEVELRDGFPKAIDELYRYHAVILDDIEAGFFTQDQLALLRSFVSQRGGGLLMLGGPDSFADGKYDRTPVGELLPVYLNRSVTGPAPGLGEAEGKGQTDPEYRLVLTREGWLQPWVRTRKTEDEERQRLASMASFHTLSRVDNIKPGAVVLAEVRDASGASAPALVAQQFGKGHVAALLIGDLWRWGIRREDPTESDLDRSWRQTVRWLVGDVPGRLEVSARPRADSSAETASSAIELSARVRDPEYRPLDNAKVAFRITLPDGEALNLDAEPDGREAGVYAATYVPRQPGAYRVVAAATAPDGSAIGEREAGWAAQPAADEFARLEPDREYLKSIAEKTHGEIVDGERLESFVASLSSRHAPITEPWTSPLWHQPLYLLITIVCLTAEWGLRRVNGLA
jgi:hypothetical protein